DSSLVVLLDFIICKTTNANYLKINVDILKANKANKAEADKANKAKIEEAKKAKKAEKTKKIEKVEKAEIVANQHVLYVIQIQEVSLEQISDNVF
ncbi:3575_t:CDS:2, partial [Cetraspora pellucida]